MFGIIDAHGMQGATNSGAFWVSIIPRHVIVILKTLLIYIYGPSSHVHVCSE